LLSTEHENKLLALNSLKIIEILFVMECNCFSEHCG